MDWWPLCGVGYIDGVESGCLFVAFDCGQCGQVYVSMVVLRFVLWFDAR